MKLKLLQSRLFQGSIAYLGSEVLNRSVSFLLLPILTRYLSPADYGIVSTFSALVAILSVFAGVNVHGAINVAFFKIKHSSLRVYIFNAFLILAVSSLVVASVMTICDTMIGRHLSMSRGWLYIALVVAVSQFITLINLCLWQAEQKAFTYAAYQVAQTVLNAGLTLLFVVRSSMHWEGQLLAIAISSGIFAALSLIVICARGYLNPIFRKEDVRELLNYGVPLIPHSLGGWLRTGADRILLTVLVGSAATGIYSVGYQIGMIVGIVASSFNRAFSPYLFSKLANITRVEKTNLVRYTYAYFGAIVLFAGCLGIASPWLLSVFLGKQFQGSSALVIWIAFGYAFDGMYYMVVNYIFYQNQTTFLAIISLCVSLVHIMLSFILVKLFGSAGPAYATTVSSMLAFILTWILSKRVYPMPWFEVMPQKAVA